MDDLKRSRRLYQFFTAIIIALVVAIMVVPNVFGGDDFIFAISGLVTINTAAALAAGYFGGQARILSRLNPDARPER